jgi:hypothetical protein
MLFRGIRRTNRTRTLYRPLYPVQLCEFDWIAGSRGISPVLWQSGFPIVAT